MVVINLPDQARPPRDPIYHRIKAGTRLYRIFDPTRYQMTATSFRFYGPLHRFDHHIGAGPPGYTPRNDPSRAVYYAAHTLSSCVVERFGDTGSITIGEERVAKPKVTRDLVLLDLRGSGAMRVGSVAALAKIADRKLTQAWARYFYDRHDLFGQIDGIMYANAHNDEDALVLNDRAANALICPPAEVLRLDDPHLQVILEDIAIQNNLVFL